MFTICKLNFCVRNVMHILDRTWHVTMKHTCMAYIISIYWSSHNEYWYWNQVENQNLYYLGFSMKLCIGQHLLLRDPTCSFCLFDVNGIYLLGICRRFDNTIVFKGLLSLINFSEGMLHMMEYGCVDLDLTKENAKVTTNCTTIALRFTISWFRWQV